MCNNSNISDSLIQDCPQAEVVEVEVTEPKNTPEITIIQWLDNNKASATEYLVNAKAIVKLTTINVTDGTDLNVVIREVDGAEDLQSFTLKVTKNTAQTDPLTILTDWKDKALTIAVNDDIKKPDSSPEVNIKPQFCDPLDEMQIRCNKANNLFGKVRESSTKNHQGFDYYAADGTDIKAVSNGKIDRIVGTTSENYGKHIVLKIDNSTYFAFYAHLSNISVTAGATVKQGDVLGQSGCTGNASGFTGNEQHLHFECRTASSLGLGLTGRENPNNIVVTKFYSQDDSKTDQGAVGVKKVDVNNNETLMEII